MGFVVREVSNVSKCLLEVRAEYVSALIVSIDLCVQLIVGRDKDAVH